MNRKLKLALAALLGFSAACSSVKNVPKESEKQDSNQVGDAAADGGVRRMVVMYGVRTPVAQPMATPLKSDSLKKAPAKVQTPELDPVFEKAED